MFTDDKTPNRIDCAFKKNIVVGTHPFPFMRFRQTENAWHSEYYPFSMMGHAIRLFPVSFADAILSSMLPEYKIVDLMLRLYYI